MNLHLFFYKCSNCGCSYKSPRLAGQVYGEFLLLNTEGQMRYLDAKRSTVFKEVSGLVANSWLTKNKTKPERAKILHDVFKIACDYDGTKQFSITQKPTCPSCGKLELASWGPTNPPEFVQLDILPVTHETWNNLSDEQKKVRLELAIQDYLVSTDL